MEIYKTEVTLIEVSIVTESKEENTTRNIIYLSRQPTGGSLSVPSLAERMILMSTYEEFQIIIGVAMLIIAILNLKNKK